MKGIKAQGNQLTTHKVKQVNILKPIEFIPSIQKPAIEIEEVNNQDMNNNENEPGSTQATLF